MKKNFNCGSSETIRKAPKFSFNLFYKYGHAKHMPRIEESFLEWFIGFFEGDGSFSVDSNKNTKRRLYLTISQKEKTIIEKIAYTFGFGYVYYFKKNDNLYWQWRISSKKGLEQITLLFFGNLVLAKRQTQFLKWVKIGKSQGLFNYKFNTNLIWGSTVSLNNAWLSGFIDAEGCFYANFSVKKLFGPNKIIKPKFYQSFSLKQTISNENDIKLFNYILLLFESNSKVYICYPTNKTKYLSIQLSSQKSQKLLINYIFNYKLKTIKHISFLRWWRIYLLKTKKKELFISENLSEKSIKKIKRLVKQINLHS
uniref:hypothetical protein n=1 Tax=Ulva meridionalis TaxID=434723 RepID=UPI0028E0A3C0|nr:hypothetical protein NQY40_pgp031 [Ulva meridionalis]WFS80080.1 hypothetical protein [Ulva meridionalis]